MSKIAFAQAPRGEGGDFPVLPSGSYDFEIVSVDEATSGNGNPQYRIKMRVLNGAYADQQFMNFVTVTPKSAWRLREIFEACGAPLVDNGKDAEGNELFECDSDDLIGRTLTITKVRQEPYEGKLSNKFDKPVPYAAGGAAQTAQPTATPASTGQAKPGGYPGGAKPPAGAQPPQSRLPRS